MKRGTLIVFTGIDGSGKTTQAKLLVDSLNQDGLCVSYVWSRWEPFLLRPFIKRWKNKVAQNIDTSHGSSNEIKGKKQRLLQNPVIRWLWLILFFIDYGFQIFRKIHLGLLKKQIIISDRVFYDSVIDQAVNLWKNKDWLLNSLDSFWMKLFFPKPDIVIYIDCPEDVAFERNVAKNDPIDIEYLKDRRKLYLKLAEKYGWIKVNGTLPIDEIAVQVKEKVYKRMNYPKAAR